MYEITLMGCDDWTCFNIELTDDEFTLIEKISKESERVSTRTCMPTLQIELLTN